ncbi:hypothetical protein ACFLSQ_03210 [Bacteroidota bacterium]
MNKILKAKHWQIFVITFLIPFFLPIVFFPMATAGNHLIYNIIIPITMLIFIAGVLGWYWAVAIGLQSKIPQDVKMSVRKFKYFFITPMIYILFFIVFINLSLSGTFENGNVNNQEIFRLILPLHLFSMFCIIYCLYFVAKTFKTVELQREVSFSDFAGDLFFILVLSNWNLDSSTEN